MAIYYGSTLQQWNLYGLDQIGHMKADAGKFFYLKDHLGSTRAVIDTLNQVVSAQDYPEGMPSARPVGLYSGKPELSDRKQQV